LARVWYRVVKLSVDEISAANIELIIGNANTEQGLTGRDVKREKCSLGGGAVGGRCSTCAMSASPVRMSPSGSQKEAVCTALLSGDLIVDQRSPLA